MRKERLVVLMMFLLMLTGCSSNSVQEIVEGKVKEYALQNPDVIGDDSYIQYIGWKEEGKLNEEGRYNDLGEYAEEYANDNILSENSENIEAEKKQVHVTFAQNSYLTVNYCYDEEGKEPIEADFCYLNPGETIYAPKQPECHNLISTYVFLGYRICEYDDSGNRKEWDEISTTSKVLTIPEDYEGTELSVEPLGEYQKTAVGFNAYMIDKDGNRISVTSGTWKVNDKEYMDDNIELEPGNEYTVKYCYKEEEYYIVASEPSIYSDYNGVVEFDKVNAIAEGAFYSVQLHPFITAAVKGETDSIKKIEIQNIKDSKREEMSLTKDAKIENLKAGDKLIIETTDGYRLFSSQVSADKPENTSDGGYRYSFVVPDLINEEFSILVSKSVLKVEVASSVGNQISFDIETSGASKSNCVYERQKFGGDCLIFEDTIGVEKSVVIAAKSDVLLSDHALRFDIIKEDSNGNKTKEIAYIQTLPDSQTINIYENAFIENFAIIYKKIDIKISLVETVIYTQAEITNGSIEINYTDADINTKLHDGEVTETSREVEVVITPDEGYYVFGKKVVDGSYRDTMKFGKCNLAEIIGAHPIKKWIQVTLDTSDDYGTCVFKAEGKEISGEVSLKEGQKITLEYVITNEEYQIVREAEGLFGGIVTWGADMFSKNEEKSSIEITEAFDGKVITRNDFNFKVEKSE